MYFRDRMSDAERTLASKGVQLHRNVLPSQVVAYRLDTELFEVLVDVTALCHLFNGDLRPGSVDLVTYQEIVISICYRLLRFRSLAESNRLLDEHSVLHLGLTLFVMTIFLHHGSRKVLSFKLVPQILLDICSESTDERNDYMLFWLLIIGGIWTSSDACGSRLIPHIKETAGKMGIECWEDAQGVLQKLPWIGAVHNGPGETLWNRLAAGT